jgi:hypothetical protein
MSAHINPYAPPKAHVQDVVDVSSEAESIRAEHIKHEASIRSVGVLYYLGGVLMLVGAIGLLAAGFGAAGGAAQSFGAGLGALYLVLGALSFVVARGIRALRPWARTTSIVLSAIGLLGFPVGTLINGYILYLLLSQKGKRIFEDDYPQIVAATPHIKYRTSPLVWIVLGILFLGVAAAIVIPMLKH